jgi:phosphate transport system permease protein
MIPNLTLLAPAKKYDRTSPTRFEVAPSTRFIDRFMTHFIKIGGASIIAAVFAIFLFILGQIVPLFQDARVEELKTLELPKRAYRILGVDEWSEKPFLVDRSGRVYFVDALTRAVEPAPMDFAAGRRLSAISYKPDKQNLVFGSRDGFYSVAHVNYEPIYEGHVRRIAARLDGGPFFEIGKKGRPVRKIDYGETESSKMVAAIQDAGPHREVHAVLLTRERTLFGSGGEKISGTADLTPLLSSKPMDLIVNSIGDMVLVACANGEIVYFQRVGDDMRHWQTFTPFEGLAARSIASMKFLFGDVSIVVTNTEGRNRVFSLYIPEGQEKRYFGQTKEFEPLEVAKDVYYAPSLRNKAFLTGSGPLASLRYATTEKIRWEKQLPYEVSQAAISGKYNRILFLDKHSRLHIHDLHDPHPETSFNAFFGKLWYEGAGKPDYTWQSTGGSDDFESKLSLIPLIIGTLKGTLYALLFAVPIALVAAFYTSQFLTPKLRVIIKPAMEIMASLPSVVLGFLAALWLAPAVETKVPSVLLMIVLLPASAFIFGWMLSSAPLSLRNWLRPGLEFLMFVPLLAGVVWAAWWLGPHLERVLFIATDPATGNRVADFRLWWPQITGTPFEQRNSLVVGFMMGFAVIPIIFTITEDSLSNVPHYLRSASLALGASRWQTAIHVVLPTASAGIFSALMVGLGRAVGETMIVVMATGNTPIMDFNIFSGMRTLSANIAVELPEAPHHGTLYRALFLGAMLLFILTFAVNTIAEILRQKLREKYRTV